MSPIFRQSKHINRVDRQSTTMGSAFQNGKLLHQAGYHHLTPYPGAFIGVLAGVNEIVDSVITPVQQQSLVDLMNPIIDVLIV